MIGDDASAEIWTLFLHRLFYLEYLFCLNGMFYAYAVDVPDPVEDRIGGG